MSGLAPTERFSDRVEMYIRYRPAYPDEVVELLQAQCGLNGNSVVADIGSGPGNLTKPLLKVAGRVYGVEPNQAMREAGETLLAGYLNFDSVAGTAEDTTLEDGAVDLITAGQAFHWFDRAATRREFCRILKHEGFVALIWNDRRTDSSPFLVGYEELLHRYSPEYAKANHKEIGMAEVREFFSPSPVEQRSFPYAQHFDLEGLRGRLLSSSYVPLEGSAHEGLLAGIDDLFHRCQVDGRVAFEYDTQVFYGQLS